LILAQESLSSLNVAIKTIFFKSKGKRKEEAKGREGREKGKAKGERVKLGGEREERRRKTRREGEDKR
tara:strand:- start:148 stop:351 length:204 start_codon:yes stop_codon:yes gene_type:complete